MKKIVYSIALLFTAMAVITACSSTRNTTSNNIGRGKITGTWMVNSISYEGVVENAIQSVFDQGPASNFQGSTWTLTNSGKGMYSLSNGTNQSIYWSMNTKTGTPEFWFKKLDEGVKAKNVEAGYKLQIASADGNNLTLKAPVQYNNGTGYIVYNMVKK